VCSNARRYKPGLLHEPTTEGNAQHSPQYGLHIAQYGDNWQEIPNAMTQTSRSLCGSFNQLYCCSLDQEQHLAQAGRVLMKQAAE
jgi:hypothetical protein